MAENGGDHQPVARTKKMSVIEIPPPLEVNHQPRPKNGNFPARSRRSVWFGNSFGPLGKYGKLKKTQFSMGASSLEGFAEHLFDIFDIEQHGYVSIQELVGGLRLLWQRHGRKKDDKICQWFTEYFTNVCGESGDVQLYEFKGALDNKTFTGKLFDLLDSDEDGEIDINDFMSSLDRLECASSDTKWYQWIEDRFSISMTEDRKITFEHFKKALHLEKTFFAERFFTLFDDNGDGKIDMKELVQGLELLTNGTETDKLTFLFRVYDLDGNGYLSEDEMKTVLTSCLEESKLKLSDQQVDQLMEVFFDEVESEIEGHIGLEEFKVFLLKYPGVSENLSISAGHWLKPPTHVQKSLSSYIPKSLRWDYIQKNPHIVFFVFLYLLINAALSIWVIVVRKDEGGWVILARFNGMCLNFNGTLILVLMMKGYLTLLRSTRFGKYFPIDQHITFHKAVAVVILCQTILHFIGHLGNYATTKPTSPNGTTYEVWEYIFTTRTPHGWVNGSAGLTGILLLLILVVMFVLSQPFVRNRGFFELFYFTHHLYMIWWLLFILHAPNFWKWFIGPAILYLLERIIRLRVVNRARYGKTVIEEGIALPSKYVIEIRGEAWENEKLPLEYTITKGECFQCDFEFYQNVSPVFLYLYGNTEVTHLVIERPPNFTYKPGDYVIINIPEIAKYEWHPFTISSAPEVSGYIWLHIRGVGTWTKKLYDYYETQEQEESETKTIKRTTIRRRKQASVQVKEKEKRQTVRRRHANSVIRHRLGAIQEEEEEEENVGVSEVTVESTKKSNDERIPYKAKDVVLQPTPKSRARSLDRITVPKLEIYVDGPYGAPATHFSEAEHAVLISSGIGVTPFASILQTIMLRYKNTSHSCPNCNYSWVGDVPYSLRNLRKVDFFWINRDQRSFEWFISLLNQLELEQSEHDGVFDEHFLDMHIYMTSALRKEDIKALGLQLALELIHKKKDRDLITGLKTRTKPGRPDWEQVFTDLEKQSHGKVSVFYCGNPALGKTLKSFCQKFGFEFRQENF